MARFQANNHEFKAERCRRPFTCQIDGMKLKGLSLDWCVTRQDGQSFPLPDHIFRLLFLPLDSEASALLAQQFKVEVGITENVSIEESVRMLAGKLVSKPAD